MSVGLILHLGQAISKEDNPKHRAPSRRAHWERDGGKQVSLAHSEWEKAGVRGLAGFNLLENLEHFSSIWPRYILIISGDAVDAALALAREHSILGLARNLAICLE